MDEYTCIMKYFVVVFKIKIDLLPIISSYRQCIHRELIITYKVWNLQLEKQEIHNENKEQFQPFLLAYLSGSNY